MDPKVENIELEESSISSVYIFDVEGNRIETIENLYSVKIK